MFDQNFLVVKTLKASVFCRRNTIIKRMDLSNNSMKSDDQGVISNALRENSTLTHLSLSQNKLGDKVSRLVTLLKALTAALKFSLQLTQRVKLPSLAYQQIKVNFTRQVSHFLSVAKLNLLPHYELGVFFYYSSLMLVMKLSLAGIYLRFKLLEFSTAKKVK